ncbi:TPR repeat-containing protein [Beutenbergia cavernae DSM 12333]|uniref:TPR repeat-containing protein n=1 Tax=Beutenbergia cavernae (strain ATCC BAA-8 / DSM 12333 / CCUG 43141 / JCM 11478 / NBRC 16432 / NCIMB 13614 / HKI 0122) TaxID=471853 RepID=C5C1Y3_BEUC1|nr:DUF5107 domain-containing protein [Beutenbergia cavernae]ACQ79601.1 TPR repeat-containing protein [Beutenbergia cavernae DSM 12333]
MTIERVDGARGDLADRPQAGAPSTLTVGPARVLTSTVAEDSLPLLDALLEVPVTIDDGVPPAIRRRAAAGRPRSMHPYLVQSRYGRDLTPTDLTAVTLSNAHLSATFLPGLGGRLWSLRTAEGRELLHTPPTIQPANLALRNAWFAGGVEWNIGTRGHSPHTMAPLHTASFTLPDGTPVLRMWELERLRGVVYQVDAWLPPTSRALLVHVRIQNPKATDVPMYWWSNAAVPQSDDVRVLAPADHAFATSYDGGVRAVPIPVHEGIDRTWPTRSPRSADYFFDVPDAVTHPWVAAVGADGHGLAQVSTSRLRGRKLFVWGTGAGGRHWQRWLTPGGGDYLEIQAGLAPTQFEHLEMPAGASWSWVEAYGDVAADAGRAHDDGWPGAVGHVADRVAAMIGPDDLEAALADAATWADAEPETSIAAGSGWGALDARARRHAGQPWAVSVGTPFDAATIGPEQEPWSALVEAADAEAGGGHALLTGADPGTPPPSYVAGEWWDGLLAEVPPSWAREYHRGVLAHAVGNVDAADAFYAASHEHAPSAWAFRGRARVAAERGDDAACVELYAQALALASDQVTLRREAVAAALDAGDATRAFRFVDDAPHPDGRLRLLEARAAVVAGDSERAARILADGVVVPDLREGETSLSDLWALVHPGEPMPAEYDFRMA